MGLVFLFTDLLAKALHIPEIRCPGECRFSSTCSQFNPSSLCCTKTRGGYYGDGRAPGCYEERKLELADREERRQASFQ